MLRVNVELSTSFVFLEQPEHLEMVDGMVVNLLKEKWTTFLRFRFFRRMILFGVYFAIFMAALILRPGKDEHPDIVLAA